MVPSDFSNNGPTSGTGWPGCAICQRIISIKQNPKNKKHSAVNPYCNPITLWSVEKTYLRTNPIS